MFEDWKKGKIFILCMLLFLFCSRLYLILKNVGSLKTAFVESSS